jgi:CubicO group peptidase (beta-lactamase class C family)
MTEIRANRREFIKVASAAAAASAAGISVGATASPAAALTRKQKTAFAGVEDAFRAAVDANKIAGVAAVVADENGILYEGGVGRRDMDKGADMDVDTIFWITSATKASTVTACMQLVEQGKLSLDTPIGDLLPQLAKPQILEGFDASGRPQLRPARKVMTLRHLLTHTSGFAYNVWSDLINRYEQVAGLPDISTCQVAALNGPLIFEPGERWHYGTSTDWVGRAVEAASGRSLEIYFREHIYEPLGIEDTGFLISSKQSARVATAYQRQEDGSLKSFPYEMVQRPEFFMGGGGLFSTPRQYIKLLQMLMNGGTFNGVQILKPESVAMIHQNQIGDIEMKTLPTALPAVSKDLNFFPHTPHKFGFAVDVNTEQGPAGRSAGSMCWAGLFNTHWWVDPNRKVAGTIMFQILPFLDDTVMDLYAKLERATYDALA